MRVLARLFMQGLANLGRNRWAQFFTLSTVAFTSFMAGIFLLALYNVHLTAQSTQEDIQFQVYWDSGHPQQEVQEQWEEIKSWDIGGINTFTPDEALKSLAESISGDMDVSYLSRENPLPATALVKFSLEGENSRDRAQKMRSRLMDLPGVERVSYNPVQLDLARTWVRVSSGIFWPLIGLMLLITGLVVANTLKLNQMQRREEVDILALVGASGRYIQFPLLVSGALQGFLGGVISLGLLKLLHLTLEDVLYFPPLWIRIEFLPLPYALAIPGVLTLVGILSSFLAVRGRLR